MRLRITHQQSTDMANTAVLLVEGQLRAPMSARLPRRIEALLRCGKRRIVVDLENVSDIDAAGLGALVRAHKLTVVRNGMFRLANPGRRIRELLVRVRLLDALNDDWQTSEDAVSEEPDDRALQKGAR